MKQHLVLQLGVASILVVAAGLQTARAVSTSLPPVQSSNEITYLSGGIGIDQSTAIKDAMHGYPLVLEFAEKTNAGNEYLADVPVQIAGAHGKVLLDTDSQGPFMLVSLPDGRYTVTASYKGKRERATVSIAPAGHAHEMFVWPS
jgi:hypothetical protein